MQFMYSYDGKGKSQSSSLELKIESKRWESDDINIQTYGSNLEESMTDMIDVLLENKKMIDKALENIITKNFEILDTDNTSEPFPLKNERITNYYTGDKLERSVDESVDRVLEKYKEKIVLCKGIQIQE